MKRWKKAVLWVGAILLLIALDRWGAAILVTIAGALAWKWLHRPHLPEPGEGEFGPVREDLKTAVWNRQRGQCANKSCQWTKTMHLHHIKHREEGGDNRLSNLIYLCPNHHTETHFDERTFNTTFEDALPTPP